MTSIEGANTHLSACWRNSLRRPRCDLPTTRRQPSPELTSLDKPMQHVRGNQRLILVYRNQSSFYIAKPFAALLSHLERFRNRDTEMLQPNTRLKMEAHTSLKNCFFARTQANRPLAPIRGIVEPD